jgi:hypothetical protein
MFGKHFQNNSSFLNRLTASGQAHVANFSFGSVSMPIIMLATAGRFPLAFVPSMITSDVTLTLRLAELGCADIPMVLKQLVVDPACSREFGSADHFELTRHRFP